MKSIAFIVGMILMIFGSVSCGRSDLASEIQELLQHYDATVGVAVIINDSDTVVVNNSHRYPLMSVFKFHQALAVCDALSQHNIGLDSLIHVGAPDLKPDTYSPLRDDSVMTEFDISIADLLNYTLQKSDNNACDILFERVIGVRDVDAYIRSKGVSDFAITANEDDMHKYHDRCYDNWSSPLALAELINEFRNGNLLMGEYQKFIYDTMIECQTGTDRLVSPLANCPVVIGHKTGTSDKGPDGRIIAINDAGFVELPGDNHYSIVVLVSDSGEEMIETSRIIAKVSEVVYEYVINKKFDQLS